MDNDYRILLKSTYCSLKDELVLYDYKVSGSKDIDYGIQFSIIKSDKSGVVRIYFNKKKGIKYDLSQIKDIPLKNQINQIINGENIDKIESMTKEISDNVFIPIIGTDESGKGDYFGSLVIAAVYVNERTKPILEKLGVKDSKKIKDDKIIQLSASIKKICLNQYSIIEIKPETYNKLYLKFKKENKNLNSLLGWGHAKAIEDILGKVECSNVLSDKFGDEKLIIDSLQEKGKTINLRQEVKAESNIAVATASILARARFLDRLEKLSKEFSINLLKGASDSVIEQAKKIVSEKGITALIKIAKYHFKTTESVLN